MMPWQWQAEGGDEERLVGGEKMPEGGVGRPREGEGEGEERAGRPAPCMPV